MYCKILLERGSGPDDVGKIAGDLVLPGAIVLPGERLDEIVGVLGGPSHRDHPRDLLADGRIEEAFEQPDLEGNRDDFFENAAGVRQELVRDAPAIGARRRLAQQSGADRRRTSDEVRCRCCQSAIFARQVGRGARR